MNWGPVSEWVLVAIVLLDSIVFYLIDHKRSLKNITETIVDSCVNNNGPEWRISTSIQPPVCTKHNEQMVLSFYDRPGSPPGNGWSCQSCYKERSAKEQIAKSLPLILKFMNDPEFIARVEKAGYKFNTDAIFKAFQEIIRGS
jgi:hypothetical protein